MACRGFEVRATDTRNKALRGCAQKCGTQIGILFRLKRLSQNDQQEGLVKFYPLHLNENCC